MVDASGRPIAIDLFAGAGGLSEGLLAAGINVAVAVEQHPHPALTHAFNHPDTTVLCTDIREINEKKMRWHVEQRCEKSIVDVVVGGPPCQGFSVAGKRNKHDPRNGLVHQFVRILESLKPKYFIFENVLGLSQPNNLKTLQKLLDGFWQLGYHICGLDNESEYYPTEYPVVNAHEFGIPQRRRRLVLLGWQRGLVEPVELPKLGTPNLTVDDAIRDLDFLKGGQESHLHQVEPDSIYQKERRGTCKFVFNHLTTKHHKRTTNMFRRFRPGSTVSSIPWNLRTGKQRVRRFCWTEPSPAVLALPDDYIHPRCHRIPTVREMARLQSFDDNYVFLGKRTTSDKNRKVDVPQYTQVGNAVPPLLAKRLAEAILKSLALPTVDLRNLRERTRRQAWLVGSSAYSGYGLHPDALHEIGIVSDGNIEMFMPITDEANGLGFGNIGIANWTSMNGKARKLANGKNQETRKA